MSNLGAPLLVKTGLAICDGCGREGELFTDLRRAIVFVGWAAQTDATAYEGDTITTSCPALNGAADEVCGGRLVFQTADLSDWQARPVWWPRATEAIEVDQ